jgi:iron complex outermembrane receptor protein
MSQNTGNTRSIRAAVCAALGTALFAGATGGVLADTASPGPNVLTDIIVTGTRQGGMAVLDSPAPVQLLSADALRVASGSPDLMSTLAQIVPSLNLQAFGFDMAGQTLQARLRGLSPNHVLILLDGKRRHTTANLAIDTGSSFQGGANVDLNFIPLDSIDHIEVLTDGAAAQYGTDAIAGVINIILKKNSSGGSVAATYGEYGTRGGETTDISGNVGFELGARGYLNLTGDYKKHGHSFVGAIDERVVNPDLVDYPIDANMTKAPGFPYLNRISGDGAVTQKTVLVSAGMKFEENSELYFVGTYGHKDAASFENYRLPHKAHYVDQTTGLTVYPYPLGFSPQEQSNETDYQLNVGFKGALGAWSYDLSTGFGSDKVIISTIHSYNPSYSTDYNVPTPTDYYDGFLKATQWTTTLDVNRDVDIGWAGPLNIAFGGEYRRENYTIGDGVPLSWLDGGAAGYSGFTPADAGSHDRTNESVYVDLAARPIDKLRIDVAARFEHYSDFGNATVGKLTGRYDFSPEFALRGTLSNGFRAPTLAEENYTSTTVSPNAAYVQLAPNSPGGRLLGLGNGLQPEHSVNLSLGAVWRPQPGMSVTLDVYQITVTNRIVGSGSLVGTDYSGNVISSLINDAIVASGNQLDPTVAFKGINVFANGIDTQTRGVDLVFDFPVNYSFGKIDWSIGANYSSTTATKYAATPANIAGGNPPVNELYDPNTYSMLTTANPKYVINLGALYTRGKLSVNLVEAIYGPSSDFESDDGDNGYGGPYPQCVPRGGLFICAGQLDFFENHIHTTAITNLDVSYKLSDQLTISGGAQNLFNTFPPLINATQLAHENNPYYGDNVGTNQYALFSPFGINGGYYYLKARYKF